MSKVRPTFQHPRYDLSVIRPVDEPVKPVSPSVVQIEPTAPPVKDLRETDSTFLSPKKKEKSFVFWPNLLWVGLGLLLAICLVLVVVVPIAVVSNTGRTEVTLDLITTLFLSFREHDHRHK